MAADENDWLPYPGGHHLHKGMPELLRAVSLLSLSESALLLLLAQPKLKSLGIVINSSLNPTPTDLKMMLLTRLEERLGSGQKAHAAYKALEREIISFARTYGALYRSAAE